MTKDSSVFKSVLTLKCPKCRKGDLFCNKTIYKYKGFFDMPDYCSKCNQDFQIETGFYLGAMFVSYGLAVALNLFVFVVFVVFDTYKLGPFLIAAAIVMILVMPFMIKVSRSIWIALSIKYDPNAIKDYEAQH